ncbi:MAG: hypothetical protein KBD24_00070 [Candidatus Pacebacteria bacterium]|nr:hypothetical protein [Candidatus Paceibacterota bacterium]
MNAIHHAIVYEGDRATALVRARAYVEEEIGIPYEANADVSVYVGEQYTIDEARELKTRAYQTPLGSAQVFVLAVRHLTHQAQNALLKLFEEPAHNTHFVLIVPSVEVLLPTVRSRMAYGGRVVGELVERDFAQKFLVASVPERLKMVQPLYTGVKDPDKQAVRTRARHIVDALEAILHEDVRANAVALKEIAFIRQYLGDTSSSLKMLLEHVVYTV